MSAPCYIGDEATAAGFRLAGARVLTPDEGEEAAAFALARTDAPLVLVSAAIVPRLRGRVLEAALAALAPLTLIVPDLRGEAPLPDLAARLRRELGLDESR
jgi:vacuolar-type H+-ATPase subunit F/Vma7